MNVRKAVREDLWGLLQLYTHLGENPLPTDTRELEELWKELLQKKNHYIIVAEENGEVVSSCVLMVALNLTHGQRPYALIENVVTHPSFRGQGYASACLHFAKELALVKNCYKIMLLTGSRREETLSFYRKAGYNSQDKTAFILWL